MASTTVKKERAESVVEVKTNEIDDAVNAMHDVSRPFAIGWVCIPDNPETCFRMYAGDEVVDHIPPTEVEVVNYPGGWLLTLWFKSLTSASIHRDRFLAGGGDGGCSPLHQHGSFFRFTIQPYRGMLTFTHHALRQQLLEKTIPVRVRANICTFLGILLLYPTMK